MSWAARAVWSAPGHHCVVDFFFVPVFLAVDVEVDFVVDLLLVALFVLFVLFVLVAWDLWPDLLEVAAFLLLLVVFFDFALCLPLAWAAVPPAEARDSLRARSGGTGSFQLNARICWPM
ncbi:membrane hypothetical protein [Paraburkholderia sacchari]